MRIALVLEYDGRGHCGFQSQPSGCGVQDALEAALADVAGVPARVTAAGRTDAGVHATAQVVHFDCAVARPVTAWVRGVNASLPPSVAVLFARKVEPDFHARFSALARHYSYLLHNRGPRPALDAGRVGWYHQPLDADAMHEAAQMLLGAHDFSSFRAAECQADSPVRTVLRAQVHRHGEMLRLDFSAHAFLHHMIRNLVGALVYVGAGKHDATWLRALLEARDRRLAPPTFAPDGLYFTGVDYPQDGAMRSVRREAILTGSAVTGVVK